MDSTSVVKVADTAITTGSQTAVKEMNHIQPQPTDNVVCAIVNESVLQIITSGEISPQVHASVLEVNESIERKCFLPSAGLRDFVVPAIDSIEQVTPQLVSKIEYALSYLAKCQVKLTLKK